MRSSYLYISMGILLILTGCKKFVEVEPPYTLTATTTVFKDASSATAAQLGVYISLSSYTPFNLARRTGAYSDELTNYDNMNDFSKASYRNSLTASLSIESWTELYTLIYAANSVITGVQNAVGLPNNVKSQLMGEAKFSRAFFYFYLVNLFGDVPMPLDPDYSKNSLLARTSKAQVYQQMIADLKEAEGLLNVNFVDATSIHMSTDRIRPTKWAAQALLARVYLYNADYTQAEAMAASVIGNASLFTLGGNLNDVFVKNSTEAIWQLDNQGNHSPTYQGYNFIMQYSINTYGEGQSAGLSPQLVSAFEPGDQRLTNWVGTYNDYTGVTYYYPFKYKEGYTEIPTQNETVLRLAEQYLIRAEARAQQENISGAADDLNVIRNRAGLSDYAGTLDKASLLTAVLHERQVELFAEWGHRWFDLKRTGTVNTVMTAVAPLKGGSWSSFKQLWPVPLSEIAKDANLTQNPGY